MLGVNARLWAMLVVLAVLVGGAALAFAAPDGFIVSGPLTATDQEAQEGYFAVGAEFAVVTKLGSPVHDDLTRLVGRAVVVVVESK